MAQGNGNESTSVRTREAKPVKVVSLVDSVVVFELKKKFDKKKNQNERLLNSLKYI